jgi:hypothetical protein
MFLPFFSYTFSKKKIIIMKNCSIAKAIKATKNNVHKHICKTSRSSPNKKLPRPMAIFKGFGSFLLEAPPSLHWVSVGDFLLSCFLFFKVSFRSLLDEC